MCPVEEALLRSFSSASSVSIAVESAATGTGGPPELNGRRGDDIHL